MTDTGSDRVRGVVLAGGRSTRFGDGDKALATLDGRPLVARVVDAVADATETPPVLSVATDEQAERLRDALGDRPVETVADSPGRSGPLAGLAAAVDVVDAPWLFVCACDMPLVSPESVDALRSRLHESGGDDSDADGAATADSTTVDAVVPVVDGFDQPLHALYRRSALTTALRDHSAGDSMMALLDELAVERIAVDDADAPLAAATTNVNTRADLDAVRERVREE
ncbi:molybdenum cofactor guanylyltransferase [Halosimplex salinum]|uniref:molybdenum cofactor guanylyltransferase n=1 Tax=Halosimplex salinum TaxID=1710538 RepID=UPI000F4A9E9F|nr:molybdenum cofactor guanylyltransferase [Halosimplex salinum]